MIQLLPEIDHEAKIEDHHSPLEVDQHDLHLQWHLLTDYLRRVRAG